MSYVTDVFGQILSRQEADANTATGDPRELYYYFNGQRVGDVGNNGTSDTDYVTAIAQRSAAQGSGAFRNGAATGTAFADFDQSYQPLNPSSSGTGSTYTVRDGDSLASVAAALWGDQSLWYLIADANGLSGTGTLAAGTTLRIPANVTNLHNNASTFKVYDPNKAIGDTAPTAAAHPPASNRCGVLGAVILVAIAVAVAAYLGPEVIGAATSLIAGPTATAAAAAAATTAASAAALGSFAVTTGAIAGGALAAAAGSIVSQGFGLATGLQDSFSWKGVAIAAIAGGVGGGLRGVDVFKGAGKFVNDVTRGALGSTITQGVGLATGLQSSFDWTGVAAAGIGSGIGAAVGRSFNAAGGDWSRAGQQLVAGTAGATANAASRSLIDGTDFGDNIMAALPDVIGSTIGNMVAGGIQQAQQRAQMKSMFAEATSDPGVQGYLQQIGYSADRPMTEQGLVDLLSADTGGLSAADRIKTIGGNIGKFVTGAAGGGSVIDQALGMNAALIATYSAIGLTMPKFQWTFVGAFMAKQVRDQLLNINTFAKAGMLTGGITGMSSLAAGNYLISTLIQGQLGVVTDIGSLALTYKQIGGGILGALGGGQNLSAYRGFQFQVKADAGSAIDGLRAAMQFGIREQTGLQKMWDDTLLVDRI